MLRAWRLLVFPRAKLSARICLGFRGAITRCIAFFAADPYDTAMTDDLELRASDAVIYPVGLADLLTRLCRDQPATPA